jgi:hypothetical protein
VQKLGELSASIIKERKENFENVASSATAKIGWLGFFAIAPIAVYFVSTLAGIFKSTGLSELALPDSVKIGTVVVCAVLFLVMIFSKRLKNG